MVITKVGEARNISARTLRGSALSAAAMAMPAAVVTNAEVGSRMGRGDGWIKERTGIAERRIAAPGERLVDYAAAAGVKSLSVAGLEADEVDLLLVATMTPDQITPNAAPVVAARIGATRCGALDVGAACCGWLSAVAVAVSYIEARRADTALVIGADLLSRVTDLSDPATAPLFGDGAGAAVVSAVDGPTRIGPVVLGADPAGIPLVHAELDEGVIRMEGHDTYKLAVRHLMNATLEAVERADATLADVDLFVFHQANGRILDAVGARLGLAPERVVTTVDRFGNTSAATVPTTLAHAAESGTLRRGQRVLMAAFGAGFTYAATLVEWGAGA